MKYTSKNPNGINQVASSSVAISVLNTDVAVFTTSSFILGGALTASNALIIGDAVVTNSLTSSAYTFLNSPSVITSSNAIENWYYSGNTLSVGAQDTIPEGLFFKSDGTKLYIIGSTNDRIYAYDLSTAWDVGSAVYNSENFFVGGLETSPTDLYIKDDGSTLWIIGATNDRVVEYAFGTPWNISTLTAVRNIVIGSVEGSSRGIYFRSDGTKMFIVGANNDRVYEYNLSIAWDISTAVVGNSFSVGNIFSTPSSLDFSLDGSLMWVVGAGIQTIVEYYLSTPWDITTAVYSGQTSTLSRDTSLTGLYYSDAVSRAYVVGSTTDTVSALYTDPQISFNSSSSVFNTPVVFKGGFDTSLNRISTFFGPTTVNSTFTSNGQATFNNLAVQINTGLTANGNITLADIAGNDITLCDAGGSQFINMLNSNVFNSYKFLRILNGNFGSVNDFFIGGTGGGELNIYSTAQKFEHSGSIYIGRNLEVSGSLPDINTTYNLPTGSAILYDTFTEASNTLLDAHTPNTGSSWYQQFSGSISATVRVRGGLGQAGPTATITDRGTYYLSNTTPTVNDYQVSLNIVVFDSSDDVLWLLARWQDNDNFYAIRWSSSAGQILKKVGGTWTLLGNAPAVIFGTNTVVTFRVYKDTLTVFQNNKLTLAITDSDLTNSGSVGLGFGNLGYISSDDFDATWQVNNFTLSEITAATIQTFNSQYSNSYIENGNLGIGTTTPTFKLDVSGSARVTNNLTITGSLRGRVVTVPTASGTASMDCSQSNFFSLTLSGSSTLFLSASNIQPGQTVNLQVIQPATSGSLSYGSTFKFAGGIPYSASATGSAVDLISFISYDTAVLYGSAIKNLS